MSNPSGKPFDPINTPAFASRRANGQPTAGEQQPEEDEASQSPYAPKRLRVVHSNEPVADAEIPRFLFEANQPRPPLTEGRGASNRPASAGERHPMDLDDLGHPLEPSSRSRAIPESASGRRDAPFPQASLPQSPRGDTRSSAERDAAVGESTGDIDRLEASLRWLKRQDTDLRHERTSRPLPPAEPRPTESKDRPATDRPRPPTPRPPNSLPPKPLEPESLLAPALRRQAQRRPMRGPLLLALAGLVVAVPVAYLGVTILMPSTDVAHGPRLVAAGPETPEAIPMPKFVLAMPKPQSEDAATMAEEPPAAKEARALLPTAPAAAAASGPGPAPATAIASVTAARETIAVRQPAPVATAAPAPSVQITRKLDPAEIAMMVKQGEQFVAAGDMVAARVVFQRAAEAGDAAAAMALGATYDPLFLAKLSVLGVPADADKARGWYQKAKDLGSQEAPRRLELLANR